VPVCSNCGEDNPARARFCMACSAVLSAVPAQETRKTVTIVFSDLVGSTRLGEALDPESVRQVLTRYFDQMQAVLERHGGMVEKFIGDAVMAVFGLPRVREDDALRAVRAAQEMQACLAGLNDQLEARWGLRLASRTGVHTGEVVAGDPSTGQRLVTGDTVNTAARLEQAAPPGEVLLGKTTWQLVRQDAQAEPVEALALKGKAGRVPAYRLLGVHPVTDQPARPMDTALVGREQELTRLAAALAKVRGDARCDLVLVLGDPGVGKSRLLHEFAAGADGAPVFTGRCLAYGEGITLWPLAEAVRQAARISEDAPEEALGRLRAVLAGHPEAELVASRVAACAGLSSELFSLEELFWGVRQLLQHLAGRGPVVAIFDDVHWGEAAFLEFLEQTVALAARSPMLLICSARPDLLEVRPWWAERFAVVGVEPLAAQQTDHLVMAYLGTSGVPDAVQARVRETAGGNPLFVGQILSMLVDEGYLTRSNGSWVVTRDLSGLAIPPTISALAAARLDSLPAEERAVAGRAAVPGAGFDGAALAELCPEPLRPRLGPILAALVDKQLLQREEGGTYRFRHVLIRDAAYAGMLKGLRAELHQRFAGWLERTAGDRSPDVEELPGYHLEQAYRQLADLGPLDAAGVALGRRAAERLASSGSRALSRGDVAAAANLLGRAVALVPADHPERLGWQVDLGGALREANDLERAAAVLDEVIESARAGGDVRLESRAVVERIGVDLYLETPGRAERALQAAERMIPSLEAVGDQQLLSKAWQMMSWAHYERDLAAWDEASWRSIGYARRAGDRRQEVDVVAGLAINAAVGAVPADEGIHRCRELLEMVQGNLRAEGFVLGYLAQLYALVGEFDRARATSRQARSAVEKTGAMVWREALVQEAADIERLAGDPVAAEREVRESLRRFEALGDRRPPPLLSIALARALYEQGRYAEALAPAEAGMAAPEGVLRVVARAVLAKTLARLGRSQEAMAWAREVAGLAGKTDYIVFQAEALTDAAEAMLVLGRREEARPVVEVAVARCRQKGGSVLIRRAQRLGKGR
jgi:class 3 adenylate cyclase/tetratricopeptide (TPR) repeat protein